MATKNETLISELKINYLTEELYEEALENGQINENEIYMTPDSNLSIFATKEELENKVTLSSGNGTIGQFAVSDGNGGITWLTVVNGNEVAY